mgnify:CR=1 FL=1
MDKPTTKPNNSTVVVSALVTSGTTRLFLLKNCSESTVSTKTDEGLKRGDFTVKQKKSTSTKSNPLYREYFNIKKYFFGSERCVQHVQNSNSNNYYKHLSAKISVSKWTFWTFLLILGVRVVTFLLKRVKNISI